MTGTAPAAPPPGGDEPPARCGRWSTASHGEAPDTSPGELEQLGRHLAGCRGRGGGWFAGRCLAESAQRFAATHIVTTAVLVALLAAAVLLSLA